MRFAAITALVAYAALREVPLLLLYVAVFFASVIGGAELAAWVGPIL